MSLAEIIPWRGKRDKEPGMSLADDFEVKNGLEVELAANFPPLTPIQLELQEIGIKRRGFEDAMEEADLIIEDHEREIARLRSLNEQRRTILAGLAKHEAELNGPSPEPRKGKKPVVTG